MSVKPGARQSYLLAGAALTVLGLAGCSSSSDSDPTTLPTLSPGASTASPAPSVSPSETGKRAELAAATAVVRRYFQVVNGLHADMNASALESIFTANCPCQAQAKAVRSAAARNEHFTDHATINAIRANADGVNFTDILVDYSAGRGGLASATGKRLTSLRPQKHVRWVFRLQRSGGVWRIFRVEIVK